MRELNDRAALELLLGGDLLTVAQVSEHTGVSKVTASLMLARLQERGLVTIAGQQAGGRGPNAVLYSVVPSGACAAGLHADPGLVSVAVADITGRRIAEASARPAGTGDPAGLVGVTVERACASAGVEVARLSALVIGCPGGSVPRTGDPQPAGRQLGQPEDVLGALRGTWPMPVVIENDVDLAALAERDTGAAAGADDFALVWLGTGLGLATVLGGRLHRGTAGAAGMIGYLPAPGALLPVPGASLRADPRRPVSGGFQSLAGGSAVRALAARYGFPAPTPAAAVQAAVSAPSAESGAFLDDLGRRVAVGVASVCMVLSLGLVVLGGEIGRAGGAALASRVAASVAAICPSRPRVLPTGVPGEPVLRGALAAAVDHARAVLLASAVTYPERPTA
jgi:predicted NBD/HSP70 family sugar kinase